MWDDRAPLVSIVMPIRNESAFIAGTLASVLAQDYPVARLEVLVLDGHSTDDTRAIVEAAACECPWVRLLDNPGRIVPKGLNLAITEAVGEIIIWIDGHCEIAPDFVSRAVFHLCYSGAQCVGGPIETIGTTYCAEAIALGMSTSFGVGGSKFRTEKHQLMFVDTVAFPAYTRQAMELVGPFDEELVRDQDEEYNYRLRKLGGKVLLAPDIRSRYFGRSTLTSLWRQYFQYGYWKVRVLQKHPRQMQLRHFVPPAFVAALGIAGAACAWDRIGPLPFSLLVGAYFIANGLASLSASARQRRYLPLLPLVFAILHISYGLGFLAGLIRFWNCWTFRAKTTSEQDVVWQTLRDEPGGIGLNSPEGSDDNSCVGRPVPFAKVERT